MITITTVLKTGKFYDYTWVEKMKRSLDRYMTMPFIFKPLSDGDHKFSVNKFVQDNPGYWNKVELFRPNLYNTPTLFIDADNVIIGDLSPIIKALQGIKFAMYKSRTTTRHPNPTASSCVMYWEDDMSYIWDIWNSKSSVKWQKEYSKNDSTGRKGDQGFIREHAENLKLIHDIYPKAYDMIKFVQNPQPDMTNVSMLVFAGNKKPHTCSWNIVKEEWQSDL
jgi:hypothetical protein